MMMTRVMGIFKTNRGKFQNVMSDRISVLSDQIGDLGGYCPF